MILFTYEDKIKEIDLAIAQHSQTWTVKARPDMDYDDVAQIIRKHIWIKWKQWNQTLPLEPWVHTIISRQIINLIRNVYTNMARPCLRCPQNMGDDLCKLFTKQCSDCYLYKKWEQTRKRAHDVRLPLPIENHLQETNNKPYQDIDYPKAIEILNQRLKEASSHTEWEVYRLCNVENKSNQEVAEIMDFKYEKKYKRYKRIDQIMDIMRTRAEEIIKIHGIN